MLINDSLKLSVSLGDKIFCYRGKILFLDDEFIVILDYKLGKVRIKRSNIVIEEPWTPTFWRKSDE